MAERLTVAFESDHSVSHDGFTANYVFLDTSTGLDGEYYIIRKLFSTVF